MKFNPDPGYYIYKYYNIFQVWEGKDVVAQGRRMLGETDPLKSQPGTIRGDYCLDLGRYEIKCYIDKGAYVNIRRCGQMRVLLVLITNYLYEELILLPCLNMYM